MTLISSIITDAYRESNMIALGKTPNTNQVTEALRLFNTILQSTYGGDAGEMLRDWPLGNFEVDSPLALPENAGVDPYPPANSRLLATNAAAITVYLPQAAQDGARFAIVDPFGRLASAPVTLDGNGRTIQGNATLVLSTNGMAAEWFYRADLGGWVLLTGVASTDNLPFPERFDTMFIVLLAMRLNPRYGRSLDPLSVAALKQSRQEFVARYLQSAALQADDSISWPFMSRQSYSGGRPFSSTIGFNQGRII